MDEGRSWRIAAARHRIALETLGHAYAAAFSAAVELVVEESMGKALAADAEGAGHRARVYRRLCVEMGLGLTSLKATVTGRRWVTLTELDAALASREVGPVLWEELGYYVPLAHTSLLHRGQNPDPAPGVMGGAEQTHRMTPPPMTQESAQRDVDAAVRQIELAAESAWQTFQRAKATEVPVDPRIDWQALVLALRPRRTGAIRTPSPEGTSLAGLVRARLGDGREWSSAEVKSPLRGQSYRGRTPGSRVHVDDAAVDRVLSRLYREGEIIRVSPGTYRAVSRSRGDSETS